MALRILFALAVSSVFASGAAAQAPQRPPQSSPDAQQPQARPGGDAARQRAQEAAPRRALSFRGSFVCEKMRTAPDILHVPVDLLVRDGVAIFARPIVGWNGRPVYGSEIGVGNVEDGGNLRLVSNTTINGVTYVGEYSGRLAENGGTFSGMQTWAGRGTSGSRTCFAAFVSTPTAPDAGPGAPQDQ